MEAFSNWAEAKLPQTLVDTVVIDYKTAHEDPIYKAANMLTEVQFADKNPNVMAYDKTYSDLQMALNNVPTKSAKLNSKTDSSSLAETWAQAEVSGIFDIFGASASSSYESSSLQMSSAGISIDCKFEKVLTFAARPLMQPSTDTYLQNYTPWFNSAALNTPPPWSSSMESRSR